MKFMVIYRDIKSTKERRKDRELTDEQELDARVERLQKAMKVPQPSQGMPITVEGFPAREVEFFADTGWHKARVIVADSRVYIVLAGGGTAQPGDLEVQQFLDSFKITDDKLMAEGKRREDQAKRDTEKTKADKQREAKRQAEEEEEQNRRSEERKASARAVAELREAAEAVIEAVEDTGLEAKAARPAAPPLPVAPPPRPVGE